MVFLLNLIFETTSASGYSPNSHHSLGSTWFWTWIGFNVAENSSLILSSWKSTEDLWMDHKGSSTSVQL